jgi:hypothetical protein
VASPRVKKLPYLVASRSPHSVTHPSTVAVCVMLLMKQSLEMGAWPGGRRHTWIRSPSSRPRTWGNRLSGSVPGCTVMESNRASSSLDTYSTQLAQLSASVSFCRIRSLRL